MDFSCNTKWEVDMQLIFIHGSGGSGESFYYQTKYFTDSIAIDLPGHPEGSPCSTIDAYTNWLHDYIKAHDFSDVILAGHSLGGGICLNYALTFPGELKALILIGSGLKLRVHPMFLDAFKNAIDTPELFEEMIDPVYTLVPPQLAHTLKQRSIEIGPRVMLNDMQACDAFSIIGREKEITLPTLAICGADDLMTPPKYSQFMADTLPNAQAAIIDGGTHFVFAEKPDDVNQMIEDFIKKF